MMPLNGESISELNFPAVNSNADNPDVNVSSAKKHSATVKRITKQKRLLTKKLHSRIYRLKCKNESLTKENQELRKKRELGSAEDVLMLASAYLNDSTLSFFETQFRVGRQRKRGVTGRKWTEKDQTFALALYHISKRAYFLLKKIFVLPSHSSIKNWKKAQTT